MHRACRQVLLVRVFESEQKICENEIQRPLWWFLWAWRESNEPSVRTAREQTKFVAARFGWLRERTGTSDADYLIIQSNTRGEQLSVIRCYMDAPRRMILETILTERAQWLNETILCCGKIRYPVAETVDNRNIRMLWAVKIFEMPCFINESVWNSKRNITFMKMKINEAGNGIWTRACFWLMLNFIIHASDGEYQISLLMNKNAWRVIMHLSGTLR